MAINSSRPILSRKRRYIAFPDGSSFSVAASLTVGVLGNPQVGSMGMSTNWGVAYDLPNETWILARVNGFGNGLPEEPKPVVQRRYRRDLYKHIEIAIDNVGFNGRDCILRTLCESAKYLAKKNGNMIERILETIFSFPKSRIFSYEHPELFDYNEAFKKGRKYADCSYIYSHCSFSLIDLALGKYSQF